MWERMYATTHTSIAGLVAQFTLARPHRFLLLLFSHVMLSELSQAKYAIACPILHSGGYPDKITQPA